MEHAPLADGPVPKHLQLAHALRQLAAGQLPHSAAPSERELMQRYGVSRATVRESVGRLVQDGVLYRVHGKGTFVAAPRLESQLHLESFTQDMRRRGHQPATAVVSATTEHPPQDVAASLHLEPRELAHHLVRVRSADGTPIVHESCWLPADALPGLLQHDLTGSVYELLDRAYGMPLESGTQTVWAEAADATTAAALRTVPGAALLVFRRVSRSGGRPLECVTSRYLGDRYQVHMDLAPADRE